MKRTAEKVLSIISVILNFVNLGVMVLLIFSSRLLINNSNFVYELENSMNYPTTTNFEVSVSYTKNILNFISHLGWVFALFIIISMVLAIIGTVKVNINAKHAGILFIIAAVFAGIISLAGILLIIAGFLCFLRQPQACLEEMVTDSNEQKL